MQIRNRVNKVEFLRSVYSKEKKRCTMHLIGSMSRAANEKSAEFGALIGKLSREEVQEATEWLQARDKTSNSVRQTTLIANFPYRLHQLAEAIPVIGLDEAQAVAILDAWKVAAKAIRKARKALK